MVGPDVPADSGGILPPVAERLRSDQIDGSGLSRDRSSDDEDATNIGYNKQ
jgi:hypothetical protein